MKGEAVKTGDRQQAAKPGSVSKTDDLRTGGYVLGAEPRAEALESDETEISDVDGGWFRARWHFSFDTYRDPGYMSFGTMRVFNDDRLVPGAVWPMHPHRDVEGLTYVVEGLFGHEDHVGGAFGPVTDLRLEDWDYTYRVLVHGVPVVVPNNAGCMEAIDGGRYGFIYGQGDTDDLAACTRDAMKAGRNPSAKAHVKAAYDWRIVVPQLDEVYGIGKK